MIDIVQRGDTEFANLVADAPEFTEDENPMDVSVAEINEAPVAATDFATVTERSSFIIDVLANDSDPERDALQLFGGSVDVGGTVEVVDDRLLVSQNPDFVGDTVVRYFLGDDMGNEV